jgi:signal transduction histidine kinase
LACFLLPYLNNRAKQRNLDPFTWLVQPMEPQKALHDIRRSLHELAQPLAAVTGIVDLMLLEQEGESPLYEDIQLINERLEKVLEIVAHIQAITRAAI